MDIFVQAKNGIPYNVNAFNALEGFGELGYPIQLFEPSEIFKISLSETSIIVGGIATVQTALERLSINVPEPLDYPPELKAYTGRNIEIRTLSDLLTNNVTPYFAKPATLQASLKGTVINNERDLINFRDLPPEALMYVSELVQFQCEYRVFVLNRRPFACKHYRGNSLIFPDSRVVLEAIEAYSSSPIAYALDVGVTDRGDTLLVEINDGYSLGSYGLLPIAYARFIEARWKEFWGLPFEMNYPASFA